MKVVHLVAGGLEGGAARGAYWLHSSLMKAGVDSFILTNSKCEGDNPSVYSLSISRLSSLLNRVCNRLLMLPEFFYPNRRRHIFSNGIIGCDYLKHPKFLEADIVHLHWINGLVSLQSLKKIDKPIVWTLRDMWPMTGGCHTALNCDRYIVGCGGCPQLMSNSLHDLSSLVILAKKSSYQKTLK